jgi:glycosyltransferase involved in cell wall biosynthesis
VSRKKILFLKYGSFSLVNREVENLLRRGFPSHELLVVDVAADLLPAGGVNAVLLWTKATLTHSHSVLRRKNSPWDFVLRDPRGWSLVSRLMRQFAGRSDIEFVFQTQSLFDAFVKGVPLFVYTDHTRLAHRRYPGASHRQVPETRWIQLERELYQKATVSFTTSGFAAESIIDDYGVKAERVESVQSGCNIDLPEIMPRRDRPLRTILFLGIEWERKGGAVLLEAMKEVWREFPDAVLEVVGCGSSADNRPGVFFRGRIPRGEVPSYLLQADIMCLPSYFEPSAVALSESAGYGLPVVSTRVGGTPERVIHGQTGILVQPGDASELASALLELMRNPAKANLMGKAGRELVLKNQVWPAVAEKIINRIERELLSFRPA